ncbi:uncharacterized protein A4U43_C06F14890 [Asparagus officinalis]|uniref:tRNA(Ile)-lysidine/2-thiocytidine synthase N-terminal domain-containing protein n=1 Tax=Asparagus officinalis TaxID=4686 RepID=A0A5P1EM02_ASPOF|nr:uncharacterized protein A4U43_C06F14890 [Asparagus officinalis]
MAFISQLFSTYSHYSEGNQGILLVRPMLELSKDDMYKICKGGYQEWVEDPTNQRPLFARNRLRMSLKNISSNAFKSEMQRLISACRITRSFIENVCRKMIEHCVTITDTSLTAAGCYLSPAPQSKGKKILVSSHDSPQSSTASSSHTQPFNKQPLLPGEIDQIISHLKSCSDKYIPEAHDVHFLHAKSPEDVLNEAKRLNLISESTLSTMQLLQMEERNKFISKPECESSCKSWHEKGVSSSSYITLSQGESCHFMSRFLVAYEVCRGALEDGLYSSSSSLYQESVDNQDHLCQFCMSGQMNSITIRHMVNADWLYLAKVSNRQSRLDFQDNTNAPVMNFEQILSREVQCSAHMRVSAKKALQTLKSIPVSARRALPVVVNSCDLLLSIPFEMNIPEDFRYLGCDQLPNDNLVEYMIYLSSMM